MKYKLLLLFLILIGNIQAQHYEYYFGGSSAGGFTMLPHIYADKPLVMGGQWTGAFVYEFKLKNFLSNTGLEFSYKNHIVGLGNTHVQKTIIDTQDSVYLHDYYFSNRKDKANSFALQLPLLFGYEEYMGSGGLYFLAGLKINILLQSRTNMFAEVKSIGTYDRYIDSFHDMPNHALSTYTITDVDKGIMRKFDVLLHAESGYTHSFNSGPEVESKNKESVLKIALYLEYGFLNSYKKNDNLLYEFSERFPVNYNAIQMNHLNLTDWDRKAYISNFSVGCKLTVLFKVSTKRCKTCQKLYRPKYRSKKFCSRCIRQKR